MAAVAGQGITVIRGPDNQRILIHLKLPQLLNHASHSLVNHSDLAVASGKEHLPPGPFHGIRPDQLSVTARFPSRIEQVGSRLSGQIIGKTWVFFYGFRRIERRKFFCRAVRLVRSPEIHPHHERSLLPFQLLQLAAGHIRNIVRLMALFRSLQDAGERLIREIPREIVEIPLLHIVDPALLAHIHFHAHSGRRKFFPPPVLFVLRLMVWIGIIRVGHPKASQIRRFSGAGVPFSKVIIPVSGFLKDIHIRFMAVPGRFKGIVRLAVMVGIQPRHHRFSGRHTERRGAVGAFKEHSLRLQPVKIRRLHPGMTVKCLMVHYHHQNIGTPVLPKLKHRLLIFIPLHGKCIGMPILIIQRIAQNLVILPGMEYHNIRETVLRFHEGIVPGAEYPLFRIGLHHRFSGF